MGPELQEELSNYEVNKTIEDFQLELDEQNKVSGKDSSDYQPQNR